jgi:hypothetical protein
MVTMLLSMQDIASYDTTYHASLGPWRVWLTLPNSESVFTGLNAGNFYGPLLQNDDIYSSARTSAEKSATSAASKNTNERSYTWFLSLAASSHSDPALSYVPPCTRGKIPWLQTPRYMQTPRENTVAANATVFSVCSLLLLRCRGPRGCSRVE